MKGPLRILVDHDRCVGSTMCRHIAPDVFELDANGQAIVNDGHRCPAADVLDAAEQCPQSAITVDDAETGERLFPRS